jgi:hypothetical protein
LTFYSTWNTPFINILSTFYQHFISILSTFYQHLINILSTWNFIREPNCHGTATDHLGSKVAPESLAREVGGGRCQGA